MEAREHAEGLVKYFERIAHQSNQEVWWKGLNTAREWLRLIDSDNPSEGELTAFMGIIHANRYRTSGWNDLAWGAYDWVRTKGAPVPPPEVFFAGEGLPHNIHFFEQTSQHHAQRLLTLFKQYNEEDPDNKAWSVGIDRVNEWLRLIEAPEARKSEVSMLVKAVFENRGKYLSTVWFETALSVCNWCKEIGYLDLVPDNYRSLL